MLRSRCPDAQRRWSDWDTQSIVGEQFLDVAFQVRVIHGSETDLLDQLLQAHRDEDMDIAVGTSVVTRFRSGAEDGAELVFVDVAVAFAERRDRVAGILAQNLVDVDVFEVDVLDLAQREAILRTLIDFGQRGTGLLGLVQILLLIRLRRRQRRE